MRSPLFEVCKQIRARVVAVRRKIVSAVPIECLVQERPRILVIIGPVDAQPLPFIHACQLRLEMQLRFAHHGHKLFMRSRQLLNLGLKPLQEGLGLKVVRWLYPRPDRRELGSDLPETHRRKVRDRDHRDRQHADRWRNPPGS